VGGRAVDSAHGAGGAAARRGELSAHVELPRTRVADAKSAAGDDPTESSAPAAPCQRGRSHARAPPSGRAKWAPRSGSAGTG
jgi:hypothetical protein